MDHRDFAVTTLGSGFAAAVLLGTFSPEPVLVTGLVAAAMVVATTVAARRTPVRV